VQGEANSLVPPAANTAQVGRNSLVHTGERGSVHSVEGAGWLTQADNSTQAAMMKTLRIMFSGMGTRLEATAKAYHCAAGGAR
jgi:hypothetical protein